jgi:hypothetical protein
VKHYRKRKQKKSNASNDAKKCPAAVMEQKKEQEPKSLGDLLRQMLDE